MVQITRCILLACLALGLTSGGVWAAPLREPDIGPVQERALWVDATRVDLSNARIITQILNQPIGRLFVPCFVGGQTLYATKSTLFRQMPAYRGKADVLQTLLPLAQKRHIQVYAFLDCLHWKKPEDPEALDVFLRSPDLAEHSTEGGCGLPADGKYASPFNPQVILRLKEVTQEIAERYPGLAGVVFKARLPLGTVLGYSAAARLAYIQAKQIDPFDLNLVGTPDDLRLTGEWVDWRLARMADLIGTLSHLFKKVNRQGKTAVLGYANFYRLSAGRRNTTLEDWLNWSLSAGIDEVVLEARWEDPINKDAYSSARELVSRANKSLKMAMLLPVPMSKETLVAVSEAASKTIIALIDDADLLPQADVYWKDISEAVAKSGQKE